MWCCVSSLHLSTACLARDFRCSILPSRLRGTLHFSSSHNSCSDRTIQVFWDEAPHTIPLIAPYLGLALFMFRVRLTGGCLKKDVIVWQADVCFLAAHLCVLLAKWSLTRVSGSPAAAANSNVVPSSQHVICDPFRMKSLGKLRSIPPHVSLQGSFGLLLLMLFCLWLYVCKCFCKFGMRFLANPAFTVGQMPRISKWYPLIPHFSFA